MPPTYWIDAVVPIITRYEHLTWDQVWVCVQHLWEIRQRFESDPGVKWLFNVTKRAR